MVVIYWYILAKKTYLYLAKGDASSKWEDDLNGVVRKKEFNADGKRWNEMDAICFDIFKKIVTKRYADYLKFQGSLLRDHFTLMEICFYGLLCLLFLLHYTETNVLISIFTVFNLANLSLIGATGAYLPRTCFYSYVLEGVCLLLLVAQYRPKHPAVEQSRRSLVS